MNQVLILIVFVALIVMHLWLKQDFLSPAVVNIYWNMFFILGAVILFGEGISWHYEGVWWTIGSCLLFLLGQVIGEAVCVPVPQRPYAPANNNYIYLILLGVVALGFMNPLIYLRAFGYSISDIFNVQALLKLNTEVAYDRYYGHQFNAPPVAALFSILIYMGALIGGHCFVQMKTLVGKAISLVTMIPILVLAIITNAKVGVIACVFLWIIGWCVNSFNVKSTGRLLSKRTIYLGIVIAVLGIAFLDLTMLLRIGSIDRETQLIVNQKLQEYAFGQVQAFAEWFHKRGNLPVEGGSNTYMFLTNWLGLTERKQGVYDLMPGVVTNIYTQNRGIIMDYGVVGGLVYWTVLGVIAGRAFKKVKSGLHNCQFSMVILAAMYFAILYGFIISPWIYSSYVLAFVGYAIFLMILKVFRFSFKR